MEKIKPYIRQINYYETDQMQVVHHSNYARFLEECRIFTMGQMGLSYSKMEELGIIIPVLELHSKFRLSTTFGDTIRIEPRLEKITPVRFIFSYKIYDNDTNELKHEAESVHCFVDNEFRPMNLKRKFPEIYANFEELLEISKKDDEE